MPNDAIITTTTGQEVDLTLYEPLTAFKGWVADAKPNLRSNTFRLLFDTEGVDPIPHAPLINAYGEMLVIQVYRMKRAPSSPPAASSSALPDPPAESNGHAEPSH